VKIGGGGWGVNGNLHDLRDNGKPYYKDNARMDKQCLHCKSGKQPRTKTTIAIKVKLNHTIFGFIDKILCFFL